MFWEAKMVFIRLLSELDRKDLGLAGGKGANLGALIRAGMPVPGGFCVTTSGYRAFVDANHLGAEISRLSSEVNSADPDALEAVSDQIRALFRSGTIPPALADEICAAYAALEPAPVAVAVRSSATAEDLPDLSFAGQQDTYLNILGEAALLDGVVRCWASLWTARAIGYRARNAIRQEDVALAVVVQQMIASEASGVLFTANPLSGKRSETVIDATLGLGEALVSGQVEPDHYVVDGSQILSKTLGAKAISIRGQSGGGTVTLNENAIARQALPDAAILELARLGQQAAAHFGSPQDMEWAWAGERLYVVQSRPITSLYPLPAGLAPEPLEALFSFGMWQGMLDPYTPLGQDVLTGLVAGLARLFKVTIQPRTQRIFMESGGRLWVNITQLIQNDAGRNVLSLFIPAIDPASESILQELFKDPRLAVIRTMSLRDRWRILRGLAPVFGNTLYNLFWPESGRKRLEQTISECLEVIRARCAAAPSVAELARIFEQTELEFPKILLPHLLPGVISGQAPLQILLRVCEDTPGGPGLVLELTRGMPNNVTTEMDLELWSTAQTIRANLDGADHFTSRPPEELARDYRSGSLPAAVQKALDRFLEKYGMRGVGEIDLGRPRWREDPTSILQVMQSYLQISDPAASPQAAFERGVEKATQAQIQLNAAIKNKFKAALVGWLAGRVRALGGLRETPKFTIVRMLGNLRAAFLAWGQKLVAAGQLEQADDLFFLHNWELKEFDSAQRDWRPLIAERRADYARELRRRRTPRMMLSDGTSYYESLSSAESGANLLTGTPVSAGIVEGIVHVVLDPHGAQLAPGEILVCPATDPAWTPLFLAAGGLVMEVGGMMTHGSVVAREYGIPAVVGVSQATERLQTGQRIRVDGALGRITIL
jgi:pyruvate,water dikinase